MAARISIACLRSDPAATIKARDYVPDMHRGDILCPVQRCRCELQGVQTSNRNVNGEQVTVEAFFRLPGNAEKAGRGHTTSCRYNVEKTVKRLVARSRQITELDEHAEPLLSAARGRNAEFRLHILMELLPSLRQGWADQGEDAASDARSRVGTSYVCSERLRPPYLRMAKAVLSFIARVQERPELAGWIKLKYGRDTIPWEEYFFDIGEYAALHRFLAKRGQFRRMPGKDRPVALAVEVGKADLWQTKSGHWQITGRAEPCPPGDNGPFVVRPMLYAKDETLARVIARERHVLVCGVPTLKPLRPAAKTWLKPCADVTIDIIDRAQVCRYSPMLKQ